jgi:hypothetical protein
LVVVKLYGMTCTSTKAEPLATVLITMGVVPAAAIPLATV